MNKALLIIILSGLSFTAICQSKNLAIFHLKDSTTKQSEIIAHSKDMVFISGGSIKLSDISSVELSTDRFLNYFVNNKIPVSIIGEIPQVKSPILVQPEATSTDVTELYKGLEQFRTQRNLGKGMQLFGVLAVAGGLITSTQKKPDLDLMKGLSIGGAVISTLGFVIDLDAGRHLKFKLRN